MLGSDETRRTAANCRRTLLFAMRPLKGHTITASMRTSARSATAAQNGAKCQLGSAASIVVILAVAGSREDRGSAVGSNRSGSKESLSVMGAGRRRWSDIWVFAAHEKETCPRSTAGYLLVSTSNFTNLLAQFFDLEVPASGRFLLEVREYLLKTQSLEQTRHGVGDEDERPTVIISPETRPTSVGNKKMGYMGSLT